MKKYELTNETKLWLGKSLHRIKALADFGDVAAGDIGGWVEKEENLSQVGNAWVYGNAQVYGDAQVYDNARVCGDAWVCGNAQVCGDARVCGNAWVCGNAQVYGNADYLVIGPIGSRGDMTTFFNTANGTIFVKCGCFRGDIDAFRAKVAETHGDNKHAKAYLAAADLAVIRIGR